MKNNESRPRLLIVDDEDESFLCISGILEGLSCVFETAKNGREALYKAVDFSPDLIFLDVMMPMMDGYEVCKILKQNPGTEHIPVVIVTGLDDKDAKLKALHAGASDFLAKPVDGAEVMIRTKNLLRIKQYEDFLREHSSCLYMETKKKTEELDAALRENMQSQEGLKESYLDTIYRLTHIAEYKDEATASHLKRAGLCCAHIARHLGWPAERVEVLQYASLMHDIGKVGIPTDILMKPTGLSPEEFALVKTHTTIGGKLLHGSRSVYLQTAEVIAINHHERWDGSGYPAGLRGEAIPIEARIMALADEYDALRSSRPYKPAFDYILAYRIMVEGNERIKPRHFDPQLLEIFMDTHADIENIYKLHKEPNESILWSESA
jgi:cyclic di-GMP phosphodiesterase